MINRQRIVDPERVGGRGIHAVDDARPAFGVLLAPVVAETAEQPVMLVERRVRANRDGVEVIGARDRRNQIVPALRIAAGQVRQGQYDVVSADGIDAIRRDDVARRAAVPRPSGLTNAVAGS